MSLTKAKGIRPQIKQLILPIDVTETMTAICPKYALRRVIVSLKPDKSRRRLVSKNKPKQRTLQFKYKCVKERPNLMSHDQGAQIFISYEYCQASRQTRYRSSTHRLRYQKSPAPIAGGAPVPVYDHSWLTKTQLLYTQALE